MFWQDDDKPKAFQVPDDIVDLVFEIQCRELPVDHALGLAEGLRAHLPQVSEGGPIGVHSIHLAGSQNGWERPDPRLGQRLMLSRRTKLTLRVPSDHADEVQRHLDGAELSIEDCTLRIGTARRKPLSAQGTIFARHVVLQPGEDQDENAFLQRVAADLAGRGIRIKKALCGKLAEIAGPDGPLQTRSLMIAGLTPEQSVRVQQEGVGPLRHLGCGLFIPHKGIDAVRKAEDEA